MIVVEIKTLFVFENKEKFNKVFNGKRAHTDIMRSKQLRVPIILEHKDDEMIETTTIEYKEPTSDTPR